MTEAAIVMMTLLQEHANEQLKLLAGKDRVNVVFVFGGVIEKIRTPSAITYWRCIKNITTERIARYRVDLLLHEFAQEQECT